MNKLILVAAAVLLLGAGGYFVFTGGDRELGPQNQQSPVIENQIIIKNFAFSPSVLTVREGTTVIWVNEDSVPHSIKSDVFNSEIFNKGGSFQFRFDNTGTYDYICGLHPSMKGRVVVEQ